jgi:hypothetical protein
VTEDIAIQEWFRGHRRNAIRATPGPDKKGQRSHTGHLEDWDAAAQGRRYCAVRGFWRLRGVRDVMRDLAERVRTTTLPHFHRWLASLRRAVARAAQHVNKRRLARIAVLSAAVRAVADGSIERLGLLRWRLQNTRLGRSADGIIIVPLLLVALVLGVVAATAATRSSSPTGGSPVALPAVGSETTGEAVTETVVRDGETVRIVRRKPGRVKVETVKGRSVTTPLTIGGDVVTLPGSTKTVVKTQTVTKTVTVEEVLTETQVVTSTETVVNPPGLGDDG